MGLEGALAVESLLEGASRHRTGVFATVVGGVTFVVAATRAFLELQVALNTIWRVKPNPGANIKAFLTDRLRSFGLVVAIGFLLFRYLPDASGQPFIGLYLGQSTIASSDGTAGSTMILLLWVYYSCQILLFGAEFTRVYVQRHGAKAKPESFAVKDPHAVNPKSALAPVTKG